jgi:lysyl-tRNA synthetase class 2
MKESIVSEQPQGEQEDPSVLVAARRAKLERLRTEFGVEPFGQRVDGITPLDRARAAFDEAAHLAYEESAKAAKADPSVTIDDRRPAVTVAGRVVQHRDMGKLVFMWLRDHSGDLQVSVSKANVPEGAFKVASMADYGDLLSVTGRVGRTNRGETCVWADGVTMQCKSLEPPPGKWHGLSDDETRYRRRYVDMYANPGTVRTFQLRSRIVSAIRRFMESRGYQEVETPMMQAMAGGAAARPFVTHHNTLDMQLFMRIAPELYLKRLLVGGLPKVFEINRNFRNEGVDRSHNPEFTAMEAYEAFGDYMTMLEMVESLVHAVACEVAGVPQGGAVALPFGDLVIDYAKPFRRVRYEELFQQAFGFAMEDEARVRATAKDLHVEGAATKDLWLVVNELFEEKAEALLDPSKPTFVLDYPSAISPLTRPSRARPVIAERWDLFIAGMEIGPAYTELNDPDIQLAKFTEQLKGADEEESTFRSLDEDFITALRVGMPPAGGMGMGIDRLVMLLSNSQSIRDVILFPLMRSE